MKEDDHPGIVDLGLLSPVIAHDLNNVCSVIMGMADVVLRNPELSGRAKEDLLDIRRAASRGRTILENLGDLVKRTPAMKTECGIHEVIAQAVAARRESCSQNGVRIVLRLSQEEPTVMGNNAFLRRLVLAALSTALDGSRRGDEILLKTELTARPGQRTPLVRVAIEGARGAFSDDQLRRMFKPLSEPWGLRDPMGLELYVCSAIALQHGGRFCIENLPEGGARCLFYLPVQGFKEKP